MALQIRNVLKVGGKSTTAISTDTARQALSEYVDQGLMPYEIVGLALSLQKKQIDVLNFENMNISYYTSILDAAGYLYKLHAQCQQYKEGKFSYSALIYAWFIAVYNDKTEQYLISLSELVFKERRLKTSF